MIQEVYRCILCCEDFATAAEMAGHSCGRDKGTVAGGGFEFEMLPIGTKARLDALEAYALKASGALLSLTGEAPELMTMVAGQRVADPLFCAARIDGKIRNARRRYRGPGGK